MMRTGAPLAKAPMVPRKPIATPMCAALEMTTWIVSPPPCV